MSEKTSESGTADNPQSPQEFLPGAGERISAVLHELILNLAKSREGSEKEHASLLAYTDRIILLAGGTLTLTFTVLASLSSRLHEIHQKAVHVPFVIAACWLLVSAIILGLLGNSAAIQAQGLGDSLYLIASTELQVKLKMLSFPEWSVNAVSALPKFSGDEKKTAKHARLHRYATGFRGLVQLCLLTAFILLTYFVQSNIRNLFEN